MSTDDKPFTYRDLAARLATLTDEQLDSPVRWWGEERGGTFKRIDVLEEDHVNVSGDGFEPRSVYVEDILSDVDIARGDLLPAGSVLLAVD